MPPWPPPGGVFTADYRDKAAPPPDRGGRVRVVQFNIERGYQLDAVRALLLALDPDVVALQEVDWGCARSARADVGADLAAALKLNYAFVTEFDELESPLRPPRDAGGGVHGNAILSRFDFVDVRAVAHPPAIDWDGGGALLPPACARRGGGKAPPSRHHPLTAREPRRGARVALAATVRVPAARGGGAAAPPPPLLTVYSAHLEVFCGALARVAQLASIFEDVRTSAAGHAVALCGDLNTVAHSVVRLSPHYAHGRARWATLGRTEAAWLQKAVVEGREGMLRRAGAPPALVQAARNPGLACPFPTNTPTLLNPAYTVCGVPLVGGKLDWVLLRGWRVEGAALANEAFEASDHAALVVDGVVEGGGGGGVSEGGVWGPV